MIKLKNSAIVIISLLILLVSCFSATAINISDGTGDVWHWAKSVSGTSWSWYGNVGDKPNIDITDVSYTVNDNKITLSLKVSGTIQTSEKVIYWVYYNSTDTNYWFSYTNGSGGGFGMKEMNFTTTEEFSISGNTISVVLDALGDTSKVELWGYAVEYTEIGDQTAEWWGDWAPNEEFPYYGETSGNENEPPVAAFTYTPTNPTTNQTINFDASSSSDTDGSITKYEWDWNNDGIYEDTKTTPTVAHSWTEAGSYPVILQVTDNGGATSTKTLSVTVSSEGSGGDGGTDNKGTPGFELILALCAIGIFLILKKKRIFK
jgi:PKD repeat protein